MQTGDAPNPWRLILREAIRRPLPHGLIHWRYLLPRQPDPLAAQRALWLSGLPQVPRALWWLLEGWLWVKWVCWRGPLSSWRAHRQHGARVRDDEGISPARQLRVVAGLALAYCVPPFEIYRYRLYRPENRPLVADYIYDHTSSTFHRTRNDVAGAAKEALHLLVDKERQAALFSSLGVPMAPILAVARRQSGVRLGPYLTELCSGDAIFCKPRHGSGGRGAFRASLSQGVLWVESMHGERHVGSAAEAYWADLLDVDDMLLQPLLSVHPMFAHQATSADIVTARYISQRKDRANMDESIACYCAALEIPYGTEPVTGRVAYVIVEVDGASGAVKGFPEHFLSGEAAGRYRQVLAALGQVTIPDWATIGQGSALAHRHCPGVRAIAWDWALTDDGPLLLEGNSEWGVAVPQMMKGPLASHITSSSSGSDASGVGDRRTLP